jgi:hypothetical protein
MPLLDIDTITIKRIELGVSCPNCGGHLIAFKFRTVFAFGIWLLTLGRIKVYHYRCESCYKKYDLL